MSDRRATTYALVDNGRNSVAVRGESGRHVAVVDFTWTGLRFTVQHSDGTQVTGSTRWWDWPGKWLVRGSEGAVTSTVRKRLLKDEGLVRLASGKEFAIRGDKSRSRFLVVADDRSVVVESSLPASASQIGAGSSFTVVDDGLPLMEAICVVVAWRALDSKVSLKDPSYGAANNATYM